MRVAIVSDIHGNRTAFEAVLRDLRDTAPDLVLHGGDLADSGSSPAGVISHIRDLGWPGVRGNTDEMLATPQRFETFARASPHLEPLWSALRDIAGWSRDALGDENLKWLRGLPETQMHAGVAVLHASPASLWRAPSQQASEEDLASTFAALAPTVIYGHVHHPFVRSVSWNGEMRVIANSGSAGLPYDGDPRASYLLVDGPKTAVRRVQYDIERECAALVSSGMPHAGWIAAMIRSAAASMP
ncbi:MAG: metallophosphoesterase family protein [Bryobacterales bacterium]|nr:metallophosphoesterase family protein [Bryobacterales bacterium]